MMDAALVPFLLAALNNAPPDSTPSLLPNPGGAPSATPPPEIRDIAPPIDVFPYPLWMVILAGCIAAAMLGLLIWLIVRWIRSRPAPPPPTPRQVALAALEKLRQELPGIAPYAFSIAVSDVLRAYIGAAYGLHAPRQTSPEFLASISDYANFSDADRTLLADFLEHCDMIKFAHVEADASDSEKLLGSAVAFVQGGRG